ncbi:Demethylspheroidene O-methyltransferase [Anatilimnocola aggregata]|uniref:Demethylspheroidene O-methyltransferase n=1 Tax=Anatilimnocola aggregata TaxID=2528021 RepID=A0A517YMU5_9BACT|nr:methyltransferase [Anatilimnocola aggregata]QDU31545.1 Demethylspheroidene O-methyltransferase [Anatilimnocola aggregata]
MFTTASELRPPNLDPTPLFELFRGSYATELLTAAVAHFQLFELLGNASLTASALQQRLQLERRPFLVLTTALRAMQLLEVNEGQYQLTQLAREHLLRGGAHYVGDYIGLAAASPGVNEMVARLRTNRPANAAADDGGAAFIYREGLESAMEREASARHLTLALAGRAHNVAPHLARVLDLSKARCVLDVGGGTGLYSIALLQQNPHLQAIVFDRPEVLKIAAEFATQYGVIDRLTCTPGDMFADELPASADVILLSNILHDWDEPQCAQLVERCASVLPAGGQLLIHDVFLNDDLAGPLPIALYSAALFTLTEGRAYSADEYCQWLKAAGLHPAAVQHTLIHCGVIVGSKLA